MLRILRALGAAFRWNLRWGIPFLFLAVVLAALSWSWPFFPSPDVVIYKNAITELKDEETMPAGLNALYKLFAGSEEQYVRVNSGYVFGAFLGNEAYGSSALEIAEKILQEVVRMAPDDKEAIRSLDLVKTKKNAADGRRDEELDRFGIKPILFQAPSPGRPGSPRNQYGRGGSGDDY